MRRERLWDPPQGPWGFWALKVPGPPPLSIFGKAIIHLWRLQMLLGHQYLSVTVTIPLGPQIQAPESSWPVTGSSGWGLAHSGNLRTWHTVGNLRNGVDWSAVCFCFLLRTSPLGLTLQIFEFSFYRRGNRLSQGMRMR